MSIGAMSLLELNSFCNTWNPPSVDEYAIANSVKNDVTARQSDVFFYVFRTTPYIDALYIKYDEQRNPGFIERFVFHEGYSWDVTKEIFSMKNVSSILMGRIMAEHLMRYTVPILISIRNGT